MDAGNHLQKNHDFGLKLPFESGRYYLIQYRHPLPSLTSHYLLNCRRRNLLPEAQPAREWRRFADRGIRWWVRFVRKWVLDNDDPRALRLAYEDLVRDPAAQGERLVRFFDPDSPLRRELLDTVLRDQGIGPRNDLAAFPHYDRDFFEATEFHARAEIAALGLPRLGGTPPLPRRIRWSLGRMARLSFVMP